LPAHVSIVPPALGSHAVTGLLTAGIKELTGGYFIVETDPEAAVVKILDALGERRAALGLSV